MQGILRKIANGRTVCYSEVFPVKGKEYFHFAYNGSLFLIADSYCMNPDCTCQQVFLEFVQVYPNNGRKAVGFTIRHTLNGRGYEINERGQFNKREIRAIVMHFTAMPMLLKTLNERYVEMKKKAEDMLSLGSSI